MNADLLRFIPQVRDGFAKFSDCGCWAVDHDGRLDCEFFRVDPVQEMGRRVICDRGVAGERTIE